MRAGSGSTALSELAALRRGQRAPGALRGLATFARRKPLGAASGLLVAAVVLVAIFAPLLAPYNPAEVFSDHRLEPGSAAFWLGTDNFGRDILSRILWGARVSVYVGVAAVASGTLLGSAIGLVSGYAGRGLDFLLQRLMDVILALPMLVLAMTVVSLLGASTTNVILALSIVLIPGANRIARGSVLAEKEHQYILAAQAVGCGHGRILLRHLLPNITAPIIVLGSITLGFAILVESSLSFLGLGPPPPTPTWGSMLSIEGRRYFLQSPGLALAPGLAIFFTILAFNLLGDALRDVLDPRLRGTS